MIEFHLDPRSGVATYLQIVQQVKEALRLGTIDVGDQLRAEFEQWLAEAERAGLDDESIRALISATLREKLARRVA